MRTMFFARLAARLLVIATFLTLGQAMAQAEPTLQEVYATAKAGNVEQAQVMMQQVLLSHPTSGKAHYVRAELFARQGKLALARESLETAEKLAPGLPFAKPEAVQALRAQLAGSAAHQAAAAYGVIANPPPATNTSSWLVPLLLAAGVITLGYFVFRRRAPAPQLYPAAGGAMPAYSPAYGATPYGQPAYGQATGSGLGGQILGGVATGLAVGAGVVAAEAIGHKLMGDHESSAPPVDMPRENFEPLPGNTDMGGQNFGLTDSSSWDDGAPVADLGGGGSDWDS